MLVHSQRRDEFAGGSGSGGGVGIGRGMARLKTLAWEKKK
jgi:hypothetical protein